MKDLLPTSDFWKNKKVFVTGHLGFKGAWLVVYLKSLGAKIYGYSLEPDYSPNLGEVLNVSDFCEKSTVNNILNLEALRSSLMDSKPDTVIHMAAQPLVLKSYENPLETITSNVVGTANLLEACRNCNSIKVILVITTDKCYENVDLKKAYKEIDPLGGSDIYSASKACAEIITRSYSNSFFQPSHGPIIATARAGNVIGGGDWSENRLIPDAVRAFSAHKPLVVRNPDSTRPWQHVVEPLAGYLMLIRGLFEQKKSLSFSYNFGPKKDLVLGVSEIMKYFSAFWSPTGKWEAAQEKSPRKEARLLMLDSSRAKKDLGWHSCFDIETTLDYTAVWYRDYYAGVSPAALQEQMLQTFESFVNKLK